MKLLKNLFLILVCLFGLVSCKDKEVKISNIQYNMDKYEKKAIEIAIERCKEDLQDELDFYGHDNVKIEELQIISVYCTSYIYIDTLKYTVFMFMVWSYYSEMYDGKQIETSRIDYYDIEVPIESKYLKEA